MNLRHDINTERKRLKKTTSIREQDYLYYGILDFVSKLDDKKTEHWLGEDYNKWSKSLILKASQSSSGFIVEDKAYEFSKDVLFGTIGSNSKRKEKEAKHKLRKEDDDSQRYRLNDDVTDENEYTFIIEYLSKVVRIGCHNKKAIWKTKWWEAKLKASKEEYGV
ncbi:uncharacterized protein EV154DRAFT_476936 [Mucor mucedo]|uniref:uncharacterized protein n=1 Tax=Mucor mucedo TaxID=29922 RepID=UPI002220A2BB|nr:uncharacterized protein EV154DRAFT_476936 [Mucor mucedo]KAI7895841.1 hypothetical protein EV154DRAFT_476936 [Mucor mucedo]